MSKANQKTLDTYNQGVQDYLDGTTQQVSGFQKDYLDFILRGLPKSAAILEIGSAFGRDAEYMISQGYSPDMTDASNGFVDFLNKKGHLAILLDIINEQPIRGYDLVFANAVFLHFTNDDFAKALINVKNSLKEDGKFAFTLKNGQGEVWSEEKMGAPRYFNFWDEERLVPLLKSLGMIVVDLRLSDDHKWLHVLTGKLV